MRRIMAVAMAATIAIPAALAARVQPLAPSTMTYQGRIEETGGAAPLEGTAEMMFLIFDAAQGGNLLWAETRTDIILDRGRYEVELGEEDPLPASVFDGPEAWLEVRIGGETQGPRQRLPSAPYALRTEGEVPRGAVILSPLSGDSAVIALGYAEEGDTPWGHGAPTGNCPTTRFRPALPSACRTRAGSSPLAATPSRARPT